MRVDGGWLVVAHMAGAAVWAIMVMVLVLVMMMMPVTVVGGAGLLGNNAELDNQGRLEFHVPGHHKLGGLTKDR